MIGELGQLNCYCGKVYPIMQIVLSMFRRAVLVQC